MNQFESGDLVAIADIPAELKGKVVQGQFVRIQSCSGNKALVASRMWEEFPIQVEFLCSLEESYKARAARWFLSGLGSHKEAVAAYQQVVVNHSLQGLTPWIIFKDYDIQELALLMGDLRLAFVVLP